MKWFKLFLQIIIYLLVGYFIGRIILNNWQNIAKSVMNANYVWLFYGLIILSFGTFLQACSWHLLLKSSQTTIRFRESFSTFFRSVITRYLPGGVWVFFARTYITTKLGFTKGQALFLIIIESSLAVLTSATIFIIIRPDTPYTLYLNILMAILVIGLAVFLFLPNYFIKLLNLLTRKKIDIVPLAITKLLPVLALVFCQWIAIGLCLFCMVSAFTAIKIGLLLPLLAMSAASWVIGFLLIVAPAGLGVRETILIILLNTLISPSQAIIVALLYRIIFILAELINFTISLFIKPEFNQITINNKKSGASP